MSIVRWGEDGSNVYIIGPSSGPEWECVACDGPLNFTPTPLFIRHLEWHRDRGDCVPTWVDNELKKYDEEIK